MTVKPALAIATLTLVAAATIPVAWAVSTTNVEHSRTEQFAGGKFDKTVVNNLGQVTLAHAVDKLLAGDKEVTTVNALAVDGKGTAWAATAPAGKLFRIPRGGEPELYYQAEGKTLLSLAVGHKDELYVGTGGGEGRILRITGKNTAKLILERKDLAYVWSMAVLPDGKLVAGTGPKAELLLVAPGEKPVAGEVLFASEKAKQKNILSVLSAGGGKLVYFGTDTDGLVFRYDMEQRRPFLLYDADQAEIAALAMDADGTLYAATSDPRQAGGGGPSAQREGKPAASQPAENGRPAAPEAGDPQKADPDQPVRVEGLEDLPPEVRDRVLKQLKQKLEEQEKRRAPGHVVGEVGPIPVQDMPMPVPPPTADEGHEHAGHVHAEATPSTQPEEQAAETKSAPQPKQEGPPPEVVARMRAAMAAQQGGGGDAAAGGNAVYAISPAGYVDVVYQAKTMMLSLLVDGKRVIVGTGAEGRVVAITPGTEQIDTLAKLEEVKQVLALVKAPDGGYLAGTANEAIIARVGNGYAKEGTFTSAAIDAGQVSHWGVVKLDAETPAGTSAAVQTRSGNLAEPSDQLWSAWTPAVGAADAVAIASPPARFLQYRVVLQTNDIHTTPALTRIELAYTARNQGPKIAAVKAMTPGQAGGGEGGGEGPQDPRAAALARMRAAANGGGGEGAAAGGMVMIAWQAADPNGDPLEFTLAFQREGGKAWVTLTPDPVREPKFVWPTRGVPDGRYRVRVTASDAPGNPAADAKTAARETELFTVDNTPPEIRNFKVVARDGAKVTLSADPSDALTRLQTAGVAVNTPGDTKVVLPADGVWDETDESLKFTVDLSDVKGEAAMILLTVADAAGNSATAAVEVEK